MSDLAETMHTAGPWSRVPQTNGSDLIAHEFETGNQMTPKGLRLIAFTMKRGNSLKEDEANTALILAAPAMLKALEEIERCIHPSVGGALGAIRKHALAAIAAAKGATP
jgi:hypothetical protein